jgi:hypothetical protein
VVVPMWVWLPYRDGDRRADRSRLRQAQRPRGMDSVEGHAVGAYRDTTGSARSSHGTQANSDCLQGRERSRIRRTRVQRASR